MRTAGRAIDTGERLLIRDALRNADSPDLSPLHDYLLTERERKIDRGGATKP
jgi:hypothetical protein